MDYFPEVVQAVSGPERKIYVYFSDGRITEFDTQPLINRGGVFKKLSDEVFFRSNLTVMNSTAAWDLSGRHDPTDCIDIDPETLYEAQRIADPLMVNTAS